jgi:hypothetical protein
MTSQFLPLRRIAALSVAITLFATPIASAQSPEGAPPIAAPANTTLLSPAAFARLVQQPPADMAAAPVVKDPPRINLLHPVASATAYEARAAFAKLPQQKSWASRHKKALIWTTIAAVAGLGFAVWWQTCSCE